MEGAKAAEKIAKKSREEKLREQKIESEILKSLSAISDSDQKFQTLLQRCVETEKMYQGTQLLQKHTQRTIDTLLLDKSNMTAEHQRMLLTKSKLESLCRELQSQNKTIKEDSLSKIKEEEERRKETQQKFQQSLNEIQILMNENSDKNKKLEIDNREMSIKFSQVLKQYEEREKQMERINKQMELVTQLNEAKLAKANVELVAEREGFMKQTAILEETIRLLKQQLSEAHSAEQILKSQVDMYSSKYGEFTKTFQGYKTDMTTMSKKTFKMEKEMLQWKIKYEKANSTILDLISEKQVRDEHITKTAKQLFHLQKLCRTLSVEKKAFYAKLVECNIEVPDVVITKDEEVPTVSEIAVEKGPDKLDEMLKNRDELKKNLDELHSQLASIQMKDVKKTKIKKTRKSSKTDKTGGGMKIEDKEPPVVNGNELPETIGSTNFVEEMNTSDESPNPDDAARALLNEPKTIETEVAEVSETTKIVSDSPTVTKIDA